MTNATIPFVQLASYPVRNGNLVRPLIDGEPAFRRVCESIEAAQQSVWVTMTFMWTYFEMPDGRGAATASMFGLFSGDRTSRPSR